ncbi:MAG: short-chain dehydrogenase/reductase, partial [Nocardioides sp.]|nr:short-chain dehydrogenase/reductase [Nocardioides sp.]
SPLIAYLASDRSTAITGRVFNMWGGRVSVAEGWQAGPTEDKGARWTVDELEYVVPALEAQAARNADTWGVRPEPSVL